MARISYKFKNKIIFNAQMSYFIYIILIVTPLIYLPNPINYSELPKIVFLVLMIIIMFLFMSFKESNNNYFGLREYKIICLYIILLVISSFCSYNFKFSIFGYPTRYEGLTTILVYIFLFLITSGNFVFNKKYFNIFIISMILVSTYAVLQYMGFDPIDKRWLRVEIIGRGYSTFGNPNFLGSYLTLILPITAYSFVKSGKWFYLLAAGSIYLALITSFTRSAWLGSFARLVLLLVFFLKYNYSKKYLAIIISLFIFITAIIEIQTEGRVISRMLSISEDAVRVLTQEVGNDNAGANRIFIWKKVIPLLGKDHLLVLDLKL